MKKIVFVGLFSSVTCWRAFAAEPVISFYAEPVGQSVRKDPLVIGFTEFGTASSPPVFYKKLSGSGDLGTIVIPPFSSLIGYTRISYSGFASVVGGLGGLPETIPGPRQRGGESRDGDVGCDHLLPDIGMPISEGYVTADGGWLDTLSQTLRKGDQQCHESHGYNDAWSKDERTFTLSEPDSDGDARARATEYKSSEARSYWYPKDYNLWSEQTASFTGKFPDACPGMDYILHYRLGKRSLSGGSATYEYKKQVVHLSQSGETPRIDLPFEKGMEYFVASLTDDAWEPVLGLEKPEDCGCGNEGSGNGNASNPSHASVHWAVFLSRNQLGRTTAYLRLNQENITSAVYSPVSLELIQGGSSDVQINVDSNGFRQSISPTKFVDRVLVANGYELKFYDADSAQLSGASMPYSITGTPSEIWRVSNPDGLTSTHRVRFEKISGSHVVASELAQDHTSGAWSLTEGNGLRTTTWTNTQDATSGRRIEIETISGADNVPVAVTRREYETVGSIENLMKIVRDPSGANLWESFEYQGQHGQKSSSLRWDGYREDYGYGPLGRESRYYTKFNNDWLGGEYRYSTYAPYDIDGDGEWDRQVTTYITPENRLRHEVSLSRLVGTPQGQCQERWLVTALTDASDWSSGAYLVEKQRSLNSGEHEGRVIWRLMQDGRLETSAFSRDTNGDLVEVVEVGAPAAGFASVVDGLKTTTALTPQGFQRSRTVHDIATGELLGASFTLQFDGRGRPTKVSHLDGFEEEWVYNPCCGRLVEHKERNGTTTYDYDDLGRLVLETKDGVGLRTTYDAADRVTKRERVGRDASEQVMATLSYDLAGRLVSETNAVGEVTAVVESQDGGFLKTTRTLPDAGISWELRYTDGTLYQVGGDAQAPVRYTQSSGGSGTWLRRTIRLDAGGGVGEWVEETYDRADRLVKRLYPGAAEELFYYDDRGLLERQADVDGVQTLYAYNAKGQRTVTALDLNRNGEIDYAGTDRITRVTDEVADKAGVTVLRATTELWETNGADTPVTVSIAEFSADGLQAWQTSYGLTTHTSTAYDGSGGRTETTIRPDGTREVRTFATDRLVSSQSLDSLLSSLGATTYAYDPHNRLASRTVAGVGATVYTYHADDQVATVTTPDPDSSRSGGGYDPQTTTYAYNNRGWVSKTTLPGGAEKHTVYYPTGRVKRTWGARDYPVDYTYDAQGRMKTLKTWKDFAGNAGSAVTTWNYDSQRGWLSSKRYDDNKGPAHTYTPAGRLKTRTWARGVTTTYGYSDAGDLEAISYSDGTPAVVHTYDRGGRLSTTTDAAGLLTRAYASGRLTDEAYAGAGVLAGRAITRSLDGQHRVQSLVADAGYALGYTYDAAGRLDELTQGLHLAKYGYRANTGTVETVTIKREGAERVRHERVEDRLGRLETVRTVVGATTPVERGYRYNAANQRDLVMHEDTRQWHYAYDALGQVTLAEKRLADGTTGLPGYAFGYSFDDIGNRMSTTTNGRTATYAADALNRYTHRSVPGAVDVRGEALASATVTVDGQPTTRSSRDYYREVGLSNSSTAAKARLTISATDGVQTVTETRGAFLPQTPEAFAYDLDGNLTQDGQWNYTWDAENRLVKMETRADVATASGIVRQRLTFTYDAQWRRIRKKVELFKPATSAWVQVADTKFLYDGWNLLTEYRWNPATSTYALVSGYVWGLDLSGTLQGAGGVGGLLWANLDEQTFAASADANGNVVAYVNTETQAVAGRLDCGAFGEPVVKTGIAALLPYGFSSKYTDGETGLLYYGLRYYNPSTGRWLSRDPMEEEGGLNLYGMVNNNPINDYDAFGLSGVLDRLDSFVICAGKCIEDNDPLNKVYQKVLLNLTGARIPKALVARLASAVGDTRLATLLQMQLRNPGYSRFTTIPATLSAALRAPGAASKVLHGVGASMGPFWISYGVYMAAVEAGCAAHCCASKNYLPEAGIMLPVDVNKLIDLAVQGVSDAIGSE